jgi:hypothetical protein
MPDEIELPELTQDELHDVVVACTAKNEFEAIAFIDALEEAGIPAMKQGGLIHFGAFAQPDITVPRKLLEQAKVVLEELKAEVTERGVDHAFKAENIEEQRSDEKRDQLTSEMLELSTEPMEIRLPKLSEYVIGWLADGRPAPEFARLLAAAGLERGEAEQLVEKVRHESSERVHEKLRMRLLSGSALMLLGVGLFVLNRWFPLWITMSHARGLANVRIYSDVGIIMAFVGLCIVLQANHRMNQLNKK